MFGNQESKKAVLTDIKINKIPDDFYAGTNPIIKFDDVEHVVKPAKINKTVLSTADKSSLDKKTAVGAGNKLHPVNLFTNWKFLVITGLVVLLVGGAVIGVYYWLQYRKISKTSAEPTAPVVENTAPQTVTTEPEPIITTTTENTITTPPVLLEAKLEFPSILLGDSVDADKDDITDLAEEIFSTDPAVPDTDNDKYPDGHEVFYLYNPAGKEPMKLIDSGLVNTYFNPTYLYKIYYPKSWAVGNVDSNYKDILISTITGENIEVRVLDMNVGEDFNSWFARSASGEQLGDYLPFTTVFKETGFVRKDNLVYFIPKNNQVFAIVYHTTDSNVVNYRIVAKMVARSFQFGNSTDLAPRVVEENFINGLNSPAVSTSEQNTNINAL